MAASPFTRTSKQPLRGFSSLILMGTPGAPAFSRASSLVARVLNAPQDLQASIAISAAAVLVDDGAFAAGALAGFFAGAFFSIVFFGAIGASRSRRRQKKSRRVRLLLFSIPASVSLKHIQLTCVITATTVTQVAGGMTDASQEASLTDAPQGASSRSSTWPSDGRASPSPSISSRLSEASTCDTMLAPSPKRPRLSFSSRTVSSSTPRESYHAPLGAEPPRADRNETSDEREDRLCAGQTVRDSQRPEFVLRRG